MRQYDGGTLPRELRDEVGQAVEPLAHILLGALVEAGMVVANAPDQAGARKQVGAAVGWMIGRLSDGATPPRRGRRRPPNV